MDPTKNTNNQGANAGDDRQALFTPQNEPLAGDSLSAQPAVDLSHPYLSNHPTQTFNTDTGDIILNPVGAKPKQNKRPFIIGGTILIVFVVVCLVILAIVSSSKKTPKFATTIGQIDTSIIFDETAPIPMSTDGGFAYINPEDGKQVINTKYFTADRFYGEYAVVQVGSEGDIANTLIINRAGETIITLEGDNTATYFDAENNYWLIDGDVYNTKMQKVSPKGTVGKYIGNGYLLVIEEVSASSASDQEAINTENDGASSRPAGGDDTSEENTVFGNGYIAYLDGRKVYDCNNLCSAFTVQVEGNVYAVVRVWDDDSRIVNLSANNEVIYTTTKNTISLLGNVLVERSKMSTEYLTIQDNKVTKSSRPEDLTAATISHSGEYVLEACKGSKKYTIKTVGGQTVSECDVDTYYEFSPSLYRAYYDKFKQAPILIMRNDELQLLDMSKSRVVRKYSGQDASVFDNSPFVYVQNLDDGANYICNVLAAKGDQENDGCIKLENIDGVADGYGNYFVIEGENTNYIYNAALKEIHS